jgi:hypothetical protein
MNTIIEVSATNADVKTQTSLTTVMSPPINLKSPATLNFLEGFIDLRRVGNTGSDSFIIEEPIVITLESAFYELFNDQIADPDNAANIRKSAFDQTTIPNTIANTSALNNYIGGLYAMYQVTYPDGKEPTDVTLDVTNLVESDVGYIESLTLIQEKFSFEVDAGTYSATTIVQYINDQMQNAYQTAAGVETIFYDPRSNGAAIGEENNNLYLPFSYFKNRYVEYDATTKKYKKAIVFLRMDKEPMRTDFYKDQFAYYYPQSDTDKPDIMFGTPIASLQNTDGIISFAYLHNPVYKEDTTGNRDQYIQLNYLNLSSTGISWYWTYARGGVALTALQPQSFWNDLMGFETRDKLLFVTRESIDLGEDNAPPNFDLIKITGDNSIATSTTRPYIGVSDIDNYVNKGIFDKTFLLNTAFTNVGPQSPLEPLDITNTVAFSATTPIQFAEFNSGGHYRIEIDIGYYINNFNSAKTKKSVVCLASREYLTNGFLSVFSGGQSIGLPAGSVISYITINILDPTTGKPPTDIGINNSFYFSLNS